MLVYLLSVSFVVGGCVLSTVFFLRYISRLETRWESRETEWRQRERDYIDRLLLKAHVEPLQVDRHKVLTVDDDPTPDKSPVDLLMDEDAVKEELEQIHPDAVYMDIGMAKEVYRLDWNIIEGKMKRLNAPLRVD